MTLQDGDLTLWLGLSRHPFKKVNENEIIIKPNILNGLKHCVRQALPAIKGRALFYCLQWIHDLALLDEDDDFMEMEEIYDFNDCFDLSAKPVCKLYEKCYTWMQVRDYASLAEIAEKHWQQVEKCHLTRFLVLYGQWLHIERMRQDEKSLLKESLLNLLKKCQSLVHADAYEMFLTALVLDTLQDVQSLAERMTLLLAALKRAPFLQPAFHLLWQTLPHQYTKELLLNWQKRQSLVHSNSPSDQVRVWFHTFAVAQGLTLIGNVDESRLLWQFCFLAWPKSPWIAGEWAQALYQNREFDSSAKVFENLYKEHPTRLQHSDIYSNVLYVQEDSNQLALLLNRVLSISRTATETFCIMGNYHSLLGQHAQAVEAFQRALIREPRQSAAWTLLGHEWVELKKPEAAVAAYRRALEVDPRDYRAWYGLGQTYEVLRLPYYALHYYQKAACLRPKDARMWCALAQCYESIPGRSSDACACYYRALTDGRQTFELDQNATLGDDEGLAAPRLARLLSRQRGRQQETASVWLHVIRQHDAMNRFDEDTMEACLYLAHMSKQQGDFVQAEQWATRLLECVGPAREEAKALLRELKH